ncbi:MAG: YcxB family protein [Comamonas sp.]
MTTTISYHVSEADYIAALRLYHRSHRWSGVGRVAIVVTGLVFVAAGLWLQSWWLDLVGVLYAALPWWLPRLIGEPLARRHYRRYPAMHQEQSVRLEEDGSGVCARSAMGESRLAWPLLIRWVEDADYLLLFMQPRLYFIVPKHADPQGAVIAPLQALLREHIGPAG